jgi:hypothetical protein
MIGNKGVDGENEENTEVRSAQKEPLQDLREVARLSSEVRNVPVVLP